MIAMVTSPWGMPPRRRNVMSNLDSSRRWQPDALERARVGDRYVLELSKALDLGENSATCSFSIAIRRRCVARRRMLRALIEQRTTLA